MVHVNAVIVAAIALVASVSAFMPPAPLAVAASTATRSCQTIVMGRGDRRTKRGKIRKYLIY
eukprot:12406-Heterococcus_DN1.PRE.3